MTVRKETVEEYLARGGKITVIPSKRPPKAKPIRPDPQPKSDPSCICCGRLNGHEPWCLQNTQPKPKGKRRVVRICKRCKAKQAKAICTKCVLTLRAKGEFICLICAKKFKPGKRLGKFVCPSCLRKRK